MNMINSYLSNQSSELCLLYISLRVYCDILLVKGPRHLGQVHSHLCRAKAQWVGLALIGKTLSKSKVTLLLLLLPMIEMRRDGNGLVESEECEIQI